jgi:hypothetical protein
VIKFDPLLQGSSVTICLCTSLKHAQKVMRVRCRFMGCHVEDMSEQLELNIVVLNCYIQYEQVLSISHIALLMNVNHLQ